ncbi:MAG: UvrB/UvrC motif-containing protein, partial [Methanogenium sp.]
EETSRRREMQMEYNRMHGITPVTIKKPIREKEVEIQDTKHIPKYEIPNLIIQVEAEMEEAAERLDFERAIELRNKLKKLNAEVQNE